MRSHSWWTAAVLGVVVAAAVAFAPFAWPALAVAAGAFATTVAHYGSDDRHHFSLAGTAYCLLLAVLSWLGGVPTGDGESTALALASVGAASAFLLGAIVAANRLARAAAGSSALTARSLPAVARRVVRLGATIRSAITLGAGAVRLLGVGVVAVAATLLVGVATFVLGGLGARAPIPWIGGEVDALFVAFVASVVVGFYVLGVVDASVRTARTGVESGRRVGGRVAAAIRRVREDEGDDPPGRR